MVQPLSLAQNQRGELRTSDVASSLNAGGGMPGEGYPCLVDIENLGVRMLMPIECERIMGWPDDWTRFGIDDDGRTYELKDSPRYQLCGNGEAKEWGEWIARRLMAALEAT